MFTYLRDMLTYRRMLWTADSGPTLSQESLTQGVLKILQSLINAAAELIGAGDFALVKRCEHPECVYWFYDNTKSRRRRWCSMALCGNRYKVAQHRLRTAKAAE